MENKFQRKWDKYLLNEDKNQIRIYVSKFVLTVNKQIVDSKDVANLIRKIPNVTTVSKEVMGAERKDFFKALYHIKFVLESFEDFSTYINKVLKRELHNINGLTVNGYRGTDLVEK